MTVLYPYICNNEVCYKMTAPYLQTHKDKLSADTRFRKCCDNARVNGNKGRKKMSSILKKISETNIFFFGLTQLRHHMIPTWGCLMAADNFLVRT